MARPKIRAAKFGDIPAIHEMIVEGHARSRYADSSEVSERRTKALIMQAIQRHGGVVEEPAVGAAPRDDREAPRRVHHRGT